MDFHAVNLLIEIDLAECQVVECVAVRVHRLEQVQKLPANIVCTLRCHLHFFVNHIARKFNTYALEHAKSVYSTRLYFSFESGQTFLKVLILFILQCVIVVNADDSNLELLVSFAELLIEVGALGHLLKMLFHGEHYL